MGRQEDTNPCALSYLNDDGCRTSVLKAECLEVCHIVWSMGGDRGLQNQVFPMPMQHCTSQAGLMSGINSSRDTWGGRKHRLVSAFSYENIAQLIFSVFLDCVRQNARGKRFMLLSQQNFWPLSRCWRPGRMRICCGHRRLDFFFLPWHDQVEMVIEYNGHGKSTCFFRKNTWVTETFERQKWNGGVRDEKEYVGSNGFRF